MCTSSGGGTRAPDTPIVVPLAVGEDSEEHAPFQESAAVRRDESTDAPNLQLVMERWSALPAVKAGIVAMVKTAQPD